MEQKQKIRILIVEDERLAAEDLSIRLEQHDTSVIGIAGTGPDAIKLAEEKQPDVILMDIQLRGDMDGIETARLIHENQSVPVIFATAYGDDAHISKALKDADPYGFLHKPVDDQAARTMMRIALSRFATDQMILRVNDLLRIKDSIFTGLESSNDIGDIATVLFDSFSSVNILEKFWIILWAENGDMETTNSSGIDPDIFEKYCRGLKREELHPYETIVPDVLMSSLLDIKSFAIPVHGDEEIVGLVGYTWDFDTPTFNNEISIIKDVAQLVSQSINNAQLKEAKRKSERQVKESEAHIKAIVEQSATGIFILNNESKVEYVNDRLCEIMDRDRSHLVGSNFYDYLGESRELAQNIYRARQAGENPPSDYYLDIIRPSGEVRDLFIAANSFADSEDRIKNIGHVLDVTDQNKANMELRKLSQAVEQSPVMTIITDVQGSIQYVNAEFTTNMGYTAEEVLGENPRIYNSGEHDKAYYADMWKTIKNGDVWNGDVINRKKNGDLVWERMSISPIRDSKSEITHFVALKEDISRQKSEEERARKDQKLRDILYAITSAAIKATDVSKLYEKIYHYISEIISTSNFFMAMHNKEDNTIYFPFDRDYYSTDMPDSIPCDADSSLTARTIISGKTLHIKQNEIRSMLGGGKMMLHGVVPSVWLGIPLKVKDEVIGAFVLQEYDGLTQYAEEDVKMLYLAAGQVAQTIDRARKDKALRELAEELASANGMKELLLDVITHDLRNPAGVISSISEMLQAEDEDNELYEVLVGSSESLMKVIENATVLSKLSIGENISRNSIDLVPMLKGIATEFHSQLSTASMELKLNLPDSSIVEANPIISEIPKNYISNAIKYASEGQVIELSLVEEVGHTVLRVDDHGSAIPQDKWDAVFERSVQLAKGEKKGRGLGLAIVKRIASAHDAEVGVAKSPAGGNRFYLKF